MAEFLGKYRIDDVLGKGAMGVVFRGFDPGIGRVVALKTVRKELLEAGERADLLARFQNEARAAGRLLHPNIVTVYDYGEDVQSSYIAMELVEGRSLDSLLKAGVPTPVGLACRWLEQLLGALQYAHARGVVHRDIKPANLMVLADGTLKVTDFGIARLDSSNLTHLGSLVGTPSYMAPERFLDEALDGRADIFSAGVLFYQLLTGEKPFVGNAAGLMHQILSRVPSPPSALRPELPVVLDAIIARSLAKRPADRYETADAFRSAVLATGLHQRDAGALDADFSDADETVVLRPLHSWNALPQGADPTPSVDDGLAKARPPVEADPPYEPGADVVLVAREARAPRTRRVKRRLQAGIAATALLGALGIAAYMRQGPSTQAATAQLAPTVAPRATQARTPQSTPLPAPAPAQSTATPVAGAAAPESGTPSATAGPITERLPANPQASAANTHGADVTRGATGAAMQGDGAALTTALSALTGQLPCAVLGVEIGDGPSAVFRGFVRDAADRRRLETEARQIVGDGHVNVQGVEIHSPTSCEALAGLLGPLARGRAQGPELQPTPRSHGTVYHEGEPLSLKVTGPGTPVYIYVDYYRLDHTVVHQVSNDQKDRENFLPAGASYVTGQNPHTRLTIAGPHFGDEMIVAVASPVPLFAGSARPITEPATAYVSALRETLAALGPERDQVTARVLFSRSEPKVRAPARNVGTDPKDGLSRACDEAVQRWQIGAATPGDEALLRGSCASQRRSTPRS